VPGFPADYIALMSEKKRRPGEIDKFHWYCPKCDTLLHEVKFDVDCVKAPYKKHIGNFCKFEICNLQTGPRNHAGADCL